MTIYKGFSFHEFERKRTFSVTDIELVKLDLLNHIYTRKGERFYMSDFGTRIPDLPFEPLDEITISILREDLEYVVNYDPRVELMNIEIQPDYDNHSVSAKVTMKYIELNTVDTLDLHIEFQDFSGA